MCKLNDRDPSRSTLTTVRRLEHVGRTAQLVARSCIETDPRNSPGASKQSDLTDTPRDRDIGRVGCEVSLRLTLSIPSSNVIQECLCEGSMTLATSKL